MEESILIHSLDSVWFFSNVLSSPQAKPNVESFQRNTAQEEEDLQESLNPMLQSQQNESPNAEFAFEEGELPTAKKAERSRRKKRKGKRKIIGKFEWGFDGGDNWGLKYKETCGGGFGSGQLHVVKLPPLSDGMAMKEHLKSWAHAVACTLR